MIKVLDAEQLRGVCREEDILAAIAADKQERPGIIGQARAEKALKLGLGIRADGFNVYVSGPQGSGKLTAVQHFLKEAVINEPAPADWCYIYNFEDPYQPKKLNLPRGRAVELKRDMKDLVQEILMALMKVFESDEYGRRRQSIAEKYQQEAADINNTLNEQAAKESLQIKQTPWEIFTVPLKNGEPLTDKDFERLDEKEKAEIRNKQDKFADAIKKALQENRALEKKANGEFSRLDNELAGYAISALIREIEEKYGRVRDVLDYLKSVKKDILDNLPEFLVSQKQPSANPLTRKTDFLKRYDVNVLVDNSRLNAPPVILETNPTYNNLVGRVEKESFMGTLVTDFTMIRKGSLHSANGGYLVIRAEQLFKNYFSWEAIKRAIRNKEVMIEEATDQLGYLSTKSLRPEPIALDIKVVLVGDPLYYHLLYAYDNDFKILFKVKADFDPDLARDRENTGNYVLFAKTICQKDHLRALDKGALKKLVEFGSRLSGHQGKLSARFEDIADLLREASYYASADGSTDIQDRHITRAIDEKYYRSNLIQQKINEMILQKQILIDISGSKTGQVNGISIIDIGDIAFGKPNRITCTVNLGRGGIMGIEREAELSGPVHTKGVMILTGYLAEKFFQDKPVSMSARLVFEQSYAEVEGDSASSTELYAILSNLAGLPVKQGIAVTGSVNQKGEVQAIGGVNEKIEGYFELCRLVGLNGEQGVIIPSANMQNLMLKEDILNAVRQHQFTVYAVDNIDDGIEILTGVKAGSISEPDTVHYRVNQFLDDYAKKMKAFMEQDEEEPLQQIRQDQWTSSVV